MFKAQSQRMHEAMFGGAVMPIQLPKPFPFPYTRTMPLPEQNDDTNFGPIVAESGFGSAAEHSDRPKDIRGYLGLVLSRVVQLEALDGVKDAPKRLAKLREHVSAALLLADIEPKLQAEWVEHMESLYETIMTAGKKAEAKVARLWEQASAAHAEFLNLALAEEAALRALREREQEPFGKWDGKAEARKRDAEIARLRLAHKNAHEQSAAAAAKNNQLQAELSRAKEELHEIEVRAEECTHALAGDAHFDPRTGLASQPGLMPNAVR